MENMENLKKSEEKTCSKCKETRKKFMPQLILGSVILGLSIYGSITLVKDIIELLTK
tara:strand:+ start:615 stop:785 length:171 start_codon:yes stop_codon:yes gene_type:complete